MVGCQTACEQWVLTSPNVDFIPEPVLDRIQVLVRQDGRFGVEDPIQWPQLFSTTWSHYALIQRQPTDPNAPHQPIWWKPSRKDFVPIHGSAVSFLGTLDSQPRSRLQALVDEMSTKIETFVKTRRNSPSHLNFCNLSMRASLNCLSFPSTYRDLVVQVTNVQRYWLEADAWMAKYQENMFVASDHHVSPVNMSYMGAYTADPVSAFKLYCSGVPVWLIRAPETLTSDVAIKSFVALQIPGHIEVGIEGFGQLVYEGRVGERHHVAVSKGGHTYMDIPQIFLSKVDPTSTSSTAASVPSSSTLQNHVPSRPSQSTQDIGASTSTRGSKVVTHPKTRDKRVVPCAYAI